MNPKQLIKKARTFAEPYRVEKGKDFRLKDIDPGATGGLGAENKPRAKEALAKGIEILAELKRRGIALELAEPRSSVRDMLRAEGIEENLGLRVDRYTSLADAIAG